jgi:hypothetical protein
LRLIRAQSCHGDAWEKVFVLWGEEAHISAAKQIVVD